MEGEGCEFELDAVGVEEGRVLLDERVPGLGEDGDELGFGEGVEGCEDGDAAEEFGDEAVGLEVCWEDGVEGGRRGG